MAEIFKKGIIMKTHDKRYTVQKEYCGHFHAEKKKNLEQGQMWVARFCGEWIGSALTESKASLLCIFHDDERTIKIL